MNAKIGNGKSGPFIGKYDLERKNQRGDRLNET